MDLRRSQEAIARNLGTTFFARPCKEESRKTSRRHPFLRVHSTNSGGRRGWDLWDRARDADRGGTSLQLHNYTPQIGSRVYQKKGRCGFRVDDFVKFGGLFTTN